MPALTAIGKEEEKPVMKDMGVLPANNRRKIFLGLSSMQERR
jgi:hypothetical protein